MNLGHFPFFHVLSPLILVAHTCSDPNRATQCRAHNVATDSRSFRDVARGCRATPLQRSQKRPCRTYLATPLSVLQGHFLAKRIALHGGVAATLTPIALRCATKPLPQEHSKLRPWSEFSLPRSLDHGLSFGNYRIWGGLSFGLISCSGHGPEVSKRGWREGVGD